MLRVGSKVKLPTKQTIGPCNVLRCNAMIAAKMNYTDYLVVTGIRQDERGTIITAGGKVGCKYAESDFRNSDLELY